MGTIGNQWLGYAGNVDFGCDASAASKQKFVCVGRMKIRPICFEGNVTPLSPLMGTVGSAVQGYAAEVINFCAQAHPPKTNRAGPKVRPFFLCARQGALTSWLKSNAHPARGSASRTARVPVARRDLKEAVSKTLA
jgi:hypothetical protein